MIGRFFFGKVIKPVSRLTCEKINRFGDPTRKASSPSLLNILYDKVVIDTSEKSNSSVLTKNIGQHVEVDPGSEHVMAKISCEPQTSGLVPSPLFSLSGLLLAAATAVALILGAPSVNAATSSSEEEEDDIDAAAEDKGRRHHWSSGDSYGYTRGMESINDFL